MASSRRLVLTASAMTVPSPIALSSAASDAKARNTRTTKRHGALSDATMSAMATAWLTETRGSTASAAARTDAASGPASAVDRTIRYPTR